MFYHSHASLGADIISLIVRRIEDGEKLCKDLILLVQERANIEKEYAKQMKTWSTKWNSIIEKGIIAFLLKNCGDGALAEHLPCPLPTKPKFAGRVLKGFCPMCCWALKTALEK